MNIDFANESDQEVLLSVENTAAALGYIEKQKENNKIKNKLMPHVGAFWEQRIRLQETYHGDPVEPNFKVLRITFESMQKISEEKGKQLNKEKNAEKFRSQMNRILKLLSLHRKYVFYTTNQSNDRPFGDIQELIRRDYPADVLFMKCAKPVVPYKVKPGVVVASPTPQPNTHQAAAIDGFELLPALPSIDEMAAWLQRSNDVFILQNNLVQMVSATETEFSKAFWNLFRDKKRKFRCTLYHPKSKNAGSREREIGVTENFSLTLSIDSLIRHLHKTISHAKARFKSRKNWGFRFVSDRIPFTVHGSESELIIGFLVPNAQGNEHPQIRIKSNSLAYHAIRNYFESVWSQNECNDIDFSISSEQILKLESYPDLKDS